MTGKSKEVLENTSLLRSLQEHPVYRSHMVSSWTPYRKTGNKFKAF
jgi:hypothetical protein